jgi:CheY-like chemotaxis protein
MRHTILLASHENAVRTEVKRYLTELGYQAKIVAKSSQIIDALRQHNPDLIIIDVEFPEPEINGWQVAKAIRQEFGSVLPILLLIHPDRGYEYLKPEKKELYNHILVQPVELEEISQGIEKILGKCPNPRE